MVQSCVRANCMARYKSAKMRDWTIWHFGKQSDKWVCCKTFTARGLHQANRALVLKAKAYPFVGLMKRPAPTNPQLCLPGTIRRRRNWKGLATTHLPIPRSFAGTAAASYPSGSGMSSPY